MSDNLVSLTHQIAWEKAVNRALNSHADINAKRAYRILEGHCGWDEHPRDKLHGALIPEGDYGRCPVSGYLMRVSGDSTQAYIELADDLAEHGTIANLIRIPVAL